MTVIILLEPAAGGARNTAIAMHSDPEGRKRHEEMEFPDGWSTALDQLVESTRDGMLTTES
jgi:uncharacterized protein YndB with AHSA1/START domain